MFLQSGFFLHIFHGILWVILTTHTLIAAHYLGNENLGVINLPDSPGLACNFQPWSFYLGGKRTYWGLPNNPDYELGPVTGSICDTLTGINYIEQKRTMQSS